MHVAIHGDLGPWKGLTNGIIISDIEPSRGWEYIRKEAFPGSPVYNCCLQAVILMDQVKIQGTFAGFMDLICIPPLSHFSYELHLRTLACLATSFRVQHGVSIPRPVARELVRVVLLPWMLRNKH